MAQRKLKLGIVGAGFVSQVAHIVNFVREPACEVVALAELRPKLAHQIAAQYNIPRVYPTHTALLEDPEIEAVVVITPRHLTGPVALDCLRAGKSVMTEKPMAADATQGKALVDMARHNHVTLAVGYMRLADAGIQMAKKHLDQLVAPNELGRIIYARAHCFQGEDYCNIDGFVTTGEAVPDLPVTPWPTAPDWIPQEYRNDYARFLSVYCHNISLLRYFLKGHPRVDYAAMNRLVVFDFDGVKATLEAGKMDHQGWDEAMDLYFERGHMRIIPPPAFQQNVPARVEIFRGGTENVNQVLHSGWSWSFKRQAGQFVDDVLNQRIPINNGDEALIDLMVHEEIWRRSLA